MKRLFTGVPRLGEITAACVERDWVSSTNVPPQLRDHCTCSPRETGAGPTSPAQKCPALNIACEDRGERTDRRAARNPPEPPRSPRTPHSNVAVLPVENQ